MIRTPFSPVAPGQPLNLSATEHNAFIRTAQQAGFGLSGHRVNRVAVGDVELWNNTGSDVNEGDVVRITNEMRDPATSAPINDGAYLLPRTFEFAKPAASDPLNSIYAICGEPIVSTGVGEGYVVNIAVATVDVVSSAHRYARPVAATHGLQSTSDPMAPFAIVGTLTGTGTQDIHVWQKGISTVIRQGTVTKSGGIAAGSSGEVTIWVNGSIEQWDGANHTVTAYLDWIGQEGISQDLEVYIAYFPDEDRWKIIGAQCEPVPAPAPPGHGNDIVATGTNQATGYNLAYTVNRIGTVTGSDYSVVLPDDFEQEDHCVVRNKVGSGGILTVWPDVGDEIDELTADVAVTLAPGESFTFWVVEVSTNRHWVIS